MSDTKHGFEKEYGHKHMPHKWQSSSGFRYFEQSPLAKKSHRDKSLPAWREDLAPKDTSYAERTQDKRWNMSAYGCHREAPWAGELRSPRNPFPGTPKREMQYRGHCLIHSARGAREQRLGAPQMCHSIHQRQQELARMKGVAPTPPRRATRKFDQHYDDEEDPLAEVNEFALDSEGPAQTSNAGGRVPVHRPSYKATPIHNP